jgi:hypothetical protein
MFEEKYTDDWSESLRAQKESIMQGNDPNKCMCVCVCDYTYVYIYTI